MIAELIHLYDRLQESNDHRLAPAGYSAQKIGFAIVLELDGRLHAIEDRREVDAKGKARPKVMLVPGQTKPTGQGLNPCFLWDNSAYLLGYKPDDPKPERTAEAFKAFRDKHLTLEKEISAAEFSAVCRFLENWIPSVEICRGVGCVDRSGIFQIRSTLHYVHEVPAVKAYWSRVTLSQDVESSRAASLLSGELVRVARLHEPKIKGVTGSQSSGALLISCNDPCSESYNHEQGDNSPIGEQEAFKYCTALNLLLADRKHRLAIAGMTVVFWTDKPTAGESLFGLMLDPTPQDESLRSQLHTALNAIRDGRFPMELGEPETSFFILGLTGAAGRIAVRFWLGSTLAEIYARIGEHFRALTIQREWPDNQPEYPGLSQLLRESVRKGDDIPPLLAPALLRSILFGTDYPSQLYAGVLRRIMIDGDANYIRAAVIKAVLHRNYQTTLSMSLDEQNTDPPYLLGRLFAVLEHVQGSATRSRELNKSLKERFFGSAMITPAQVFPTLLRGLTAHLGKLNKGAEVYFEKSIQEIHSQLPPEYPSRFNTRDQGLFCVGYYHQRLALFKSKSKPIEIAPEESESAN